MLIQIKNKIIMKTKGYSGLSSLSFGFNNPEKQDGLKLTGRLFFIPALLVLQIIY